VPLAAKNSAVAVSLYGSCDSCQNVQNIDYHNIDGRPPVLGDSHRHWGQPVGGHTKVLEKKLIRKDNEGRHFLSDLFFSSDNGLATWKKINRLPDYYQTDHEVELLKNRGEEERAVLRARLVEESR
jgi:hypothetical protein